MIKYDAFQKAEDERAKYKRYCKCGHSIIFTPSSKTNKTICSWCGHWIYKNDFEEFKDKLNKNIKKEAKNDSHKSG